MTLHVVDLGGPRNSGYLVITRYAIWSQQGPKIAALVRASKLERPREREWIGLDWNGQGRERGRGREPLAYAAVWDSDGYGPPRRNRGAAAAAEPVQDQASLCGAECR